MTPAETLPSRREAVSGATSGAPTPSRLHGLHPGWFASVMGTAILAVATYDNPGNLRMLGGAAHAVGTGLAVVAYAMAVVLLVAYGRRWARHREAAVADLRHPVLGALYGTVPGGLLVLAVMTSVIGPGWLPPGVVTGCVTVLAVVGGILAVTISVTFAFLLFTGEAPVQTVNGGWFIPPVVTIIIPLALVPLMSHVSAATARLLLALAYAFLGMGFLLFLLVMGMLHDRLVLHPPPSPVMAPSLWIGLGPVGVGALALLGLARAGQPEFGTSAPAVRLISQLAATGLWGFGLWWLAVVVALLVRYLRAGAVPFSLGWWAFTFPLGAFAVATLTLARAWSTPVLEGLGVALYLGLAWFWVLVTTRTLRGMRTGLAWQR